MQQHPIPQNISSYQFRLIGDFTIKQFFEAAGGLLIAFIIWRINLFFIFKAPLAFVFALSGLAMAFLPIEERPLDHWVKAFIKSIYSPTHFIWEKHNQLPQYFAFSPHGKFVPDDSQELMSAAKQRKQAGLSSFLQTIPAHQSMSRLENQEHEQLSSIRRLFTANTSSTQVINAAPAAQKVPAPHPPAPNFRAPTEPAAATAPTPPNRPVPNPQVVPLEPIRIAPAQQQPPITTKPAPIAAPVIDSQSLLHPTAAPRVVAKSPANRASTMVQTATDLPFPSTPTIPNVIAGMVLDNNSRLIENAIIEVRDKNGIPVRATKTNQLGQFFSTTPLKNGHYEIEVEKPGYRFDILKLELKGKIIDPLKITATEAPAN